MNNPLESPYARAKVAVQVPRGSLCTACGALVKLAELQPQNKELLLGACRDIAQGIMNADPDAHDSEILREFAGITIPSDGR